MGRVEGVPLTASVEPSASRATALGRRVGSTVLLLPLFVWVVAWAPAWAFAALVLLVGALGQWEFLRMFERAGVPTLRGIGVVGGLAVTASFAVPELAPVALSVVVLGGLTAGLALPGERPAWEPVIVTVFGVCYVNWLLGHALRLRALPAGVDWILLLVWVTWIGETTAYVVGSTMGRRKLAPRVSPKKTVEGALAQLLVSPLAALAAQASFAPVLSSTEAITIGLILGVVGQVGDLVESLFKRSVGTKDTGGLIPGHGGILDRIDGLLFNTPALFYYVAYSRTGP
jgi:phosphatidate cytidylyltransferase